MDMHEASQIVQGFFDEYAETSKKARSFILKNFDDPNVAILATPLLIPILATVHVLNRIRDEVEGKIPMGSAMPIFQETVIFLNNKLNPERNLSDDCNIFDSLN